MQRFAAINYYAGLEVSEDADEAAIKKAYRRLVLHWHPDKHRTDRQKAEDKIRAINAAYEVLSNPTKREMYDLQRSAMDQKRRGVAPARPRVSPRMSVPKEFMMQPIGYPDKFLRYSKRNVAVHSRLDCLAEFREFFQNTKLSLWWLPEMNNMCRIRSLGSKARGDKRAAATGVAGGLNLSFKIAADKTVDSEVRLLPAEKGKKSDSVNFVAKQSHVYEGAFRFETACRRGCYLAFFPPDELRVVPFLAEEQCRVLDFMLVDFTTMFKFIDLEEVLIPATSNENNAWVQLSAVRDDDNVKQYFRNVLQKPVWDVEDFETYFEGHWLVWEYRASDSAVRLRPSHERLGKQLLLANQSSGIVSLVAKSGQELEAISANAAAHAVRLLALGPFENAEMGESASVISARKKLFGTLKHISMSSVSEEGVELAVEQLLETANAIRDLADDTDNVQYILQRSSAVRWLADLLFRKLTSDGGASELAALDSSNVLKVLNLPGAAGRDADIMPACLRIFESSDCSVVLEIMQCALAAGCRSIAEGAASSILTKVEGIACKDASSLLVALAESGLLVSEVAPKVLSIAQEMGAQDLATALLSFCNNELPLENLEALSKLLVSKGAFTDIRPESLLGLALSAAKCSALKCTINSVAQAAINKMTQWAAYELVKLLLAITRCKDDLTQDMLNSFLSTISAAIMPQLSSFDMPEIIKLILSVCSQGKTEILVNSVQGVVNRLAEIPYQQLLLATQGAVQGLGGSHTLVCQVFEHWLQLFKRQRGSTTKDSDFLSADEHVKLLQVVTSAGTCSSSPQEQDRTRLIEALSSGLEAKAEELSSSFSERLSAQLQPGGGFHTLPVRDKLKTVVGRAKRAAHDSNKRARELGGADVGMQPKKKKKRRR